MKINSIRFLFSLLLFTTIFSIKAQAYNQLIQDEKIKFGFDIGLLNLTASSKAPLNDLKNDLYYFGFGIFPITLYFEERFFKNFLGIRAPLTFEYSSIKINKVKLSLITFTLDPHIRFYPGKKKLFGLYLGLSNKFVVGKISQIPTYNIGYYVGLGGESKIGISGALILKSCYGKKLGILSNLSSLSVTLGLNIASLLKI